jgi:hypothetical protein
MRALQQNRSFFNKRREQKSGITAAMSHTSREWDSKTFTVLPMTWRSAKDFEKTMITMVDIDRHRPIRLIETYRY